MLIIQKNWRDRKRFIPLFPDTKEKDEILILPLNMKATHGKHLYNSAGVVVRMNLKWRGFQKNL